MLSPVYGICLLANLPSFVLITSHILRDCLPLTCLRVTQEMVEQLVECLKIHGDRADLASDVWMNDIINAYVSSCPSHTMYLLFCTLNCLEAALLSLQLFVCFWVQPCSAFALKGIYCQRYSSRSNQISHALFQERMLQRCGECHPQALRMFLGLQLPEQAGQTADGALWRRVLVSYILSDKASLDTYPTIILIRHNFFCSHLSISREVTD